MRKPKEHIVLCTVENKKIKSLLKRKNISIRARKQLKLIQMLGNGGQKVTAAEIFAVSNQTVNKEVDSFKKGRIKSLLVYTEENNDSTNDSSKKKTTESEDSVDATITQKEEIPKENSDSEKKK